MTKTVTAEYDADAKVLRLVEPLEGVPNHEKILVTFVEPLPPGKHPCDKFRGILSGEDGEDLARAVEELFPTER